MSQSPKLDLAQYLARLNAAVPTPEFLSTLNKLSRELAIIIEKEPRFQRGRTGQVVEGAFENEMWATSLLV